MQQQLLAEIGTHTEYQPPQEYDIHPVLVTQDDTETQQALQILHCVLPKAELSNIQLTVLLQSWKGKTYGQMANSTCYDPDYLKDVGHKLWRKLSGALERPVSKHNFCSILRQRFHEHQEGITVSQPPCSSTSSGSSKPVAESIPSYDLGEAPTVPLFMGRTHELECLKRWMVEERHHLVGLFGLGGIGKTALAVKCVEQLRDQFDYVIWRSLRNQPDCDDFINGLLYGLGLQHETERPKTTTAKIDLLLQRLNEHRCLLVIDDWFAILRSRTRTGLHQETHDHYGLLLRRVSEGRHRSCVLVTSREKPVGLAFKDNQALPVRTLHLNGLDVAAGREALSAFGLSATTTSLEQLLERYSGNPYVLRAATATIIQLFSGHISKFLDQEQLIYGDIRRLLDQQFARLSEPEENLVCCLAKLSDWVTLPEMAQVFSLPDHNTSLIETIESLDHRSFIEKQEGRFRLPRLLQEYVRCQSKFEKTTP